MPFITGTGFFFSDNIIHFIFHCHHLFRSNAFVFTTPHSTGTAHAGLDLIEDQCHTCLITDFADLCQISIRRNDHTGLTLNWLQDHAGNLFADCLEILNRLADILGKCCTIGIYGVRYVLLPPIEMALIDLPWKAPTVEMYHLPPVAIRASFKDISTASAPPFVKKQYCRSHGVISATAFAR